MRTLHSQPGLPVCLKPLLLNAAINIFNATPNKIAPRSPIHAVLHRIPNINQLYSFGCRAYLLDPYSNKLESKAQEGSYVGTEFSKVHFALNLRPNKIIIRCDMRAHQNIFPLHMNILSL